MTMNMYKLPFELTTIDDNELSHMTW